jgi:hypothetical protein
MEGGGEDSSLACGAGSECADGKIDHMTVP